VFPLYDGAVKADPPAQIGPALNRAFASGAPYLVNVITDVAAAYPRTTTGV
jgi:acetolactate synthase I/II/III large subunit